MIAKYLWIAGSSIYFILGTIHLYYTFFTRKFSVRDKTVNEAMKNTFPALTRKTTMWKAWISFNASHSTGAIYLGMINLVFATRYFEWMKENFIFAIMTCITGIFYLFLGVKYWFDVPRTGTFAACCCFVAATVLMIAG